MLDMALSLYPQASGRATVGGSPRPYSPAAWTPGSGSISHGKLPHFPIDGQPEALWPGSREPQPRLPNRLLNGVIRSRPAASSSMATDKTWKHRSRISGTGSAVAGRTALRLNGLMPAAPQLQPSLFGPSASASDIIPRLVAKELGCISRFWYCAASAQPPGSGAGSVRRHSPRKAPQRAPKALPGHRRRRRPGA